MRRAQGCRSTCLPGGDRLVSSARKGAHPGRRRPRRRPPAAPHGRSRRRDSAGRRARDDDAARRLRGAADADRLLLHVARRPSRAGAMRRLHLLHDPGPRALASSCRATSPMRRSARARTKKASATATSWAGRCRGTRRRRRSTRCWLDAASGMMHLICYLRHGSKVFETYWTWMRGVEAMDNSYRLLDLTVYGRQEPWEESPAGWPQPWGDGKQRMRTEGRPIVAVAPAEGRTFGRQEAQPSIRVSAHFTAAPSAGTWPTSTICSVRRWRPSSPR